MKRRISVFQDSEGYILAGHIRGLRHFWTDEHGWAAGEADHYPTRLAANNKARSLVILGEGVIPSESEPSI